MMNTTQIHSAYLILSILLGSLALVGCGNKDAEYRDFFTSGSREADQRAEQRVAKTEQLRGEGKAGSGEGAPVKRSLYDRLGGEAGIQKIVDDFVVRVLADPRVNWERKGVERGGVLGFNEKSAEWSASEQNQQRLKKHLVQFFSLASGGPAKYEGRDMKEVHTGMKITNPEFDATVGDLKATLDKLLIPTEEQKELLAIVESTRVQVVEER